MRDPCLEMARQLSEVMVQGGSWPQIPSPLRLQTFAFSTESQCSVSSWLFPRTVSFVKTWEYTDSWAPWNTFREGTGELQKCPGQTGRLPVCILSPDSFREHRLLAGRRNDIFGQDLIFFRCLITSDASPAWNPELLAIESDESTFPPNSREEKRVEIPRMYVSLGFANGV